jgi:hypothetical protein
MSEVTELRVALRTIELLAEDFAALADAESESRFNKLRSMAHRALEDSDE